MSKYEKNQSVNKYSFLLKPSTIEGVGVFITHAISAGTLLYKDKAEYEVNKIKDVHPEFIKYCLYLSNEECECPISYDNINVFWFINHSDTPNTEFRRKDKSLYTLRNIKAGEELLMDYHTFKEPDILKEPYFKNSR